MMTECCDRPIFPLSCVTTLHEGPRGNNASRMLAAGSGIQLLGRRRDGRDDGMAGESLAGQARHRARVVSTPDLGPGGSVVFALAGDVGWVLLTAAQADLAESTGAFEAPLSFDPRWAIEKCHRPTFALTAQAALYESATSATLPRRLDVGARLKFLGRLMDGRADQAPTPNPHGWARHRVRVMENPSNGMHNDASVDDVGWVMIPGDEAARAEAAGAFEEWPPSLG